MALVTKNFSDIITFTRASTGTYFNAAGTLTSAAINAPRFDYNPSTLAARGLLVEEARTNLVTRSEEFNDAYWTPSAATVTANSTTAPTNTSVADTLTEDTSTGQHTIGSSTIAWAGNTQYTATFFFKANGRTRVDILLGTSGNWVNGDPARNANFDLTAGTVAFAPVSPSTASIQAIGNGWFRCSITATTTAAPTASGVFIRLCDATGSSSYTGNGTSGVFLFGAQVEAGAFPTSYIPTTTTALTRSADVASVNTLSPWFNSAAGTLFVEYNIPFDSSISVFPIVAGFSDGTFNNTIINYERTIDDSRRANIRTLGVQQFDVGNGATYTYGTNTKQALAYATNDAALSVAGTAPTTSASVAIPTVNVMGLGSTNFTGGALSSINGWLRRITYYPRRQSNAELVSITTP